MVFHRFFHRFLFEPEGIIRAVPHVPVLRSGVEEVKERKKTPPGNFRGASPAEKKNHSDLSGISLIYPTTLGISWDVMGI